MLTMTLGRQVSAEARDEFQKGKIHREGKVFAGSA